MDIGQYTRSDDVVRGNAIIALEIYTRLDDFKRGMPSSPLDSIHGHTTTCLACCHPLGQHTRSDHVGRGIPTWPLGSTYGRMTLDMACHYFLCATHIEEAGHDIITFRQHTRLQFWSRL